jgi:hypothetical protein
MSADYVVHATVLLNSPRTRWLLSCTEGRHGSLHRQRNQFSVAIPVATRRQALALQGIDEDTGSGRASSPGTLWQGLAGVVTESPLPHQKPEMGRKPSSKVERGCY